MNDNAPDPILVNDSAIPDQVLRALRLALGYGIAWAVGRGYLDALTGEHLLGFLLMAAPAVYSLWVGYQRHVKMRTIAEAAPNTVAKLK